MNFQSKAVFLHQQLPVFHSFLQQVAPQSIKRTNRDFTGLTRKTIESNMSAQSKVTNPNRPFKRDGGLSAKNTNLNLHSDNSSSLHYRAHR